MQNGANPDAKIGRVRAAWYVLIGQRVTPQQIQADWVEYQCIFNDLLERWSAKLARDAKAEKERIKRLDAATPEVHMPQVTDTKQELRRRVANLRGFGLLSETRDSMLSVPKLPEVRNEPDS